MALTSLVDYTKGPVEIPNAISLNVGEDFNEVLQSVIYRFGQEMLLECLGERQRDIVNEVISYIARNWYGQVYLTGVNGRLLEGINGKLLVSGKFNEHSLMNYRNDQFMIPGSEFFKLFYGDGDLFEGLHYMEMRYVYCGYLREDYLQHESGGVGKTENESQVMADPYGLYVDPWNEYAEMYCELQKFLAKSPYFTPHNGTYPEPEISWY